MPLSSIKGQGLLLLNSIRPNVWEQDTFYSSSDREEQEAKEEEGGEEEEEEELFCPSCIARELEMEANDEILAEWMTRPRQRLNPTGGEAVSEVPSFVSETFTAEPHREDQKDDDATANNNTTSSNTQSSRGADATRAIGTQTGPVEAGAGHGVGVLPLPQGAHAAAGLPVEEKCNKGRHASTAAALAKTAVRHGLHVAILVGLVFLASTATVAFSSALLEHCSAWAQVMLEESEATGGLGVDETMTFVHFFGGTAAHSSSALSPSAASCYRLLFHGEVVQQLLGDAVRHWADLIKHLVLVG